MSAKTPSSARPLTRVIDSARLATWRCAPNGGAWNWQDGTPGWLPTECASDLAALLTHTDRAHRERLRHALNGSRQDEFVLDLPLAGSDGDTRWLQLRGEKTAAGGFTGLAQDVTSTHRVEASLRAELSRLRLAQADADAVVFEAGLPDWQMRYVDGAIEALTGYTQDTWLSQPDFLRQIAVSEDRAKLAPGSLLRLPTNQASFVVRLRRADGRIVSVKAVFRLHRDQDAATGTARGLLMSAERDLSLTLSAEDRERHLKILYEENPAMFFSVAPDGSVRSVNKYGAGRIGFTPEQLIGTRLADLHLPGQRALLAGYIKRCLTDKGNVHYWQTCLTRRDGSDVWVRAAARAIEDAGHEEILIVCEDMTETRRLSEQLRYQQQSDLLTGLANRRLFEADLGAALRRVGNDGEKCVLCYLDLDQFKVINDTCGHDAGDKLLLRVSRLLSRHVREHDALARLGGDEFGILFRHCSLADAERRTERLCLALASDRFEWGERSYRTTASAGLVDLTTVKGTQAQLLSLADTACFSAKDQGRNRIIVYRTDNREIARRRGEMDWVSRLQHAVDHHGFELFCQAIRPLSAAASGGDALEVLLRLPDVDGDRFIKPDAFLRAAENYQLAVRIDTWVCDEVIGFFEGRLARHAPPDLCCINLSTQSLSEPAFLKFLSDRIGTNGRLARALCFEITETSVIANLQQATRFIDTLQEIGCRFALDDFGSGVSSFAYLKRLPVDIVKIDGMFVRNMAHDPIDHALVASINDIAHAMGKTTIAEYVEDDATLACLKELQIDYAQGFFVAHPVPLRGQYKS